MCLSVVHGQIAITYVCDICSTCASNVGEWTKSGSWSSRFLEEDQAEHPFAPVEDYRLNSVHRAHRW